MSGAPPKSDLGHDDRPLTREEIDSLVAAGVIVDHVRLEGSRQVREPACRHDFGAYVCAACHTRPTEVVIAEHYVGRGYSSPPLSSETLMRAVEELRRRARCSALAAEIMGNGGPLPPWRPGHEGTLDIDTAAGVAGHASAIWEKLVERGSNADAWIGVFETLIEDGTIALTTEGRS